MRNGNVIRGVFENN
jgi:hypothetical protein